MFLLDSLLVGGIRFVLDKVAQVAESELDSTERLREELLAAQLQLELGEIEEEEFRSVESRVLAALRERREAEAAEGTEIRGAGVEVEVEYDAGRESEEH